MIKKFIPLSYFLGVVSVFAGSEISTFKGFHFKNAHIFLKSFDGSALIFDSNDFGHTDRARESFRLYEAAFDEALVSFKQRHNDKNPKIICGQCKKLKFSYQTVSSAILYSLMAYPDNDERVKTVIQPAVDELINILSEGTVDQMQDFMVKMANLLQEHCRNCGASCTWKHYVKPNSSLQSQSFKNNHGYLVYKMLPNICGVVRALKKYQKRDIEKPEIRCTGCKQKHMTCEEFAGLLVSNTIKSNLSEKDTFRDMKGYLKGFASLIVDEEPAHIECLMRMLTVLTGDYPCSQCGESSWEACDPVVPE